MSKVNRCLISLSLIISLSSCTNFIFQPFRLHYLVPDKIGIDYEDIYLPVGADNKLHGWKLNTNEAVKGTVLFFHGNGENISTHIANVYWLTKSGYEVYLFDYRGYGKSDGIPDLDHVISDNELILKYVTERLLDGQKLIVIGHSLGASLSIYSVAESVYREKIKLLVSIEAFSDYQDITQEVLSKSWITWLIQYPISWSMNNDYRPLDYVSKLSPVPLLIMHSEKDEMISFYHAEKLFAAAREPKRMIDIDSNHSKIFDKPDNRALLLDYLSNYR